VTKGARTQRRLLDAAASEVARKGLAGASINTIAAQAGLKSGSVFFHFATKAALIEEMLEEGLRVTLRHLDDALAVTQDDAEARLRAGIRAHTAAVHELPDYTAAVLNPAITGGPAFRALRKTYVQRWSRLVADAQQAGVIGTGADPRLVRDLLFGALNAVSLTGRTPQETTAALENLLSLTP
jgi:AcrR family transcriptional regulator